MKRILIIIQAYDANGVTTYTYTYLKSLDKQTRSAIDIVAVYPSINNDYLHKFEELGVSCYDLFNKNNSKLAFLKKIRSFFEIHKNYVGIISMISYRAVPILFQARKKEIKNIAYIGHEADFNNTKWNPLRLKMREYLVNNVDIRAAASYKIAQTIFREDQDYIIIPNSFQYEDFYFDQVKRDQIRKSLGINKDEKVVGLIGRIDENKNTSYLFKLKDLNPLLHFLVIGNGPEKEILIDKAKSYNKITFIDEVTNIQPYYSALDCCIMPSISEGFGRVAIEAQLNGLPVIVSKGIPEEVKISDNIFFLPLEDPERWIEIIDSSSRVKTKSFDHKYSSQATIMLFKSLIGMIFKE